MACRHEKASMRGKPWCTQGCQTNRSQNPHVAQYKTWLRSSPKIGDHWGVGEGGQATNYTFFCAVLTFSMLLLSGLGKIILKLSACFE